MDIVIIGTGNVAYALARRIKGSEHRLVQVVGRNPVNAAHLGKMMEVPFAPLGTSLSKDAHLYIVAVADDALYSIGEWMQLDRKLVVHTAGSVSKDVLKNVSKNYGVLYPLQTLRKEMKILPEIPFLVDGNTPDDLALIEEFASSISGRVVMADDESRLKLHLAAVVVNNFSNHLFVLAEKYCSDEKLPFELLQPLIIETANRLTQIPAKDAQTGPAVRKDATTIAKQTKMLDKHSALKRIYEDMTASIKAFHK